MSVIRDILGLIEVRQTDIFAAWFASLRDHQARARITARIRRLSLGNPGDVKPAGSGISEMRIDYGPGYRVYYIQRAQVTVILLCSMLICAVAGIVIELLAYRPLRNKPRLNVLITAMVIFVAGFFTLSLAWIVGVIWTIVICISMIRGAVAAGRGEYFRYPMTFRFLS